MLGILLVVTVGSLGYLGYKAISDLEDAGIDTGVELSPFNLSKDNTEEIDKDILEEEFPLGDPINIALLGIDRRSRAEAGYRTDIIILMSANPKTNKVTLASIPRDLYYKGGRINAVYIQSGWEELQSAIEQITGLRPERYILTDFKDFSWIVDAMGGVPVNVQTTFTDTSYPVDETKGYQTIKFTQGPELMTGERALIFSRSRKGDFDNGDWGRMKRQHLLLKGMLDAVLQPKSIFNPMVVEEAFKLVTTGKMDTNLELKDAKYLWDFYKDKDQYEINSLYLDTNYLYTPPLEEYGGAWVLVPKGNSYKAFQDDIKNKLYDLEQPVQIDSSVDTSYTSTDL